MIHTVETLEEELQAFADTLSINARSSWLLGDVLVESVARHGAAVLGKFAEVANRSKRWVQLLRSVAARFSQDTRDTYPELTWQHFRFAASHEDVMPAEEWLELAQDEHLSTRQMAERLPKGKRYHARGECPSCGARVSVQCEVAGLDIPCPVCMALGEEPARIGVTE